MKYCEKKQNRKIFPKFAHETYPRGINRFTISNTFKGVGKIERKNQTFASPYPHSWHSKCKEQFQSGCLKDAKAAAISIKNKDACENWQNYQSAKLKKFDLIDMRNSKKQF